MGDLSDRMTGERNLPDSQSRPVFYEHARTVVTAPTNLKRVEAILRELKPSENPDDYFSEQPDPGCDRGRRLVHRLLCWYWSENATYDEVAERVREHVRRVESGDWMELHPDISEVLQTMRRLNNEERLQILSEFCRHCGSEDPHCQCWNDE